MRKITGIVVASALAAIMWSPGGPVVASTGPAESASVAVAASVAAAPTSTRSNALWQAKRYLKMTAFSKSGLYEQLRYEGYTKADSKWAVNQVGANWNKQALRKAKAYLKLMPFSKKGLREQLRYEGFTAGQAAYAVNRAF